MAASLLRVMIKQALQGLLEDIQQINVSRINLLKAS